MPRASLEIGGEAPTDVVEGVLPRRRIGVLLRIAALPVIFAILFFALDGAATLAALGQADIGLVLIALTIVQLQFLLSALRWRFTAQRLGLPLPFRRALSEYYVAGFLNQTLPGGVAGDAARAYRNRAADANGRLGWRASLRSVVLERAAGQIAFFSVAIAGLAAWPFLVPTSAPDGVEALVAAPIVVLFVLSAIIALVAARAPRIIRSAFAELGPDLRRAFLDHGAWWRQAGMSLAIVGGYVAVFAVCGAALGSPIPAMGWFTVIPMVLLAMVLPVSIGGWGVREGAAVALFPLVAVDASTALAIAILYGIVNLVGALPGLALVVRRRTKPLVQRSLAGAPQP
ncbi:MAG: UPF0104 family protein [Salinarimonadaceae bacterium]|nr:MAG: UPF0104 family protein [Salinarimonadaceae bacterium]